jgi:hypothetical protein
MSKVQKKKSEEPQVPDATETNETAPVEEDVVSILIKQLQEMIDCFYNVRPAGDSITAKNQRRLHGVGIKTLGFIETAFRLAKSFPDFAPHYINVTLLDGKLKELNNMTSLKQILHHFNEIVETAYLFSADDCYKNALAYYESLKEAYKMKESCAETALKELEPFFKSHKKKHSPSEPS